MKNNPERWEWAITDSESKSVDIFDTATGRTVARTILNYPIEVSRKECASHFRSASLQACKTALDYLKDSSPEVERAIAQAEVSRG